MSSFRSLLDCLAKSKTSEYMTANDVANEFARFKIWTGNLGALHKGSSSLDVRLRDSIVLRNAVLRLLKRLADSLEQSKWDMG
jgi:hypothetical protein